MPRCPSSAEVEVTLTMTATGEFSLPDKSVGETNISYTADTVEDIYYEHIERHPIYDSTGARIVARTSILAGVDVRNPEVQKLLTNLLELYSTEADDALAEVNGDSV